MVLVSQPSEDSVDRELDEIPNESRSMSTERDEPSAGEESEPAEVEAASPEPDAPPKVTAPKVALKASSSLRLGRARRPSILRLPEQEVRNCARDLNLLAQEISTKDLRELRMLKRPPPAVATVLEALRIILSETDLQPGSFKKLLSDTLPRRLGSFDPGTLNTAQASKLRSLLSSGEVNADAMSRTCQPCTTLSKWCDRICVLLARPSSEASKVNRGQVNGTSATDSGSRQGVGSGSESQDQQQQSNPVLLVEPDLSTLSKEDLASVHELTVMKPGIGAVVFHGATDCTDLDIQSNVVLKRGYVLVYPDATKKPPVGQGLNKRATVTMYQCFPPGERVQDDQVVEEYKMKIKRMTEENSACTFIDYDCLTGVWTFEVGRF